MVTVTEVDSEGRIVNMFNIDVIEIEHNHEDIKCYGLADVHRTAIPSDGLSHKYYRGGINPPAGHKLIIT